MTELPTGDAHPVNDPDYIVVTPDMLPLLGIRYGAGHLRRLWSRGEFPVPLQLSDHRIGWRLSDIKRWIDNRPPATRPGGQP